MDTRFKVFVAKTAAKEEFKPVARRTASRRQVTTQPVEPKRDYGHSTGIQRIRATTPVDNKVRVRKMSNTPTARQSTNTSEVKATSTQNSSVVSRNSNIDWERLGLTRPEHSSERTRARIKAN